MSNADTSFPFYNSLTYPDGGLTTSANELSQFVQEMIKSLNHNSDLLSEASIDKMVKPFFSNKLLPKNYDLKKYNNGVFWELYPDGFIGHPGGDPGVCSFIEFNKEVGILFLGNMYIDTEEFRMVLKKYALRLSGQ